MISKERWNKKTLSQKAALPVIQKLDSPDNYCGSHSSADAKGSKPEFEISLLHFVDERNDDSVP